MENELILFSVKDAGQDVGLLPVPVEEARWSTCTIRTSWLSITSEMPRVSIVSDHAVQVPAEPLWQR